MSEVVGKWKENNQCRLRSSQHRGKSWLAVSCFSVFKVKYPKSFISEGKDLSEMLSERDITQAQG